MRASENLRFTGVIASAVNNRLETISPGTAGSFETRAAKIHYRVALRRITVTRDNATGRGVGGHCYTACKTPRKESTFVIYGLPSHRHFRDGRGRNEIGKSKQGAANAREQKKIGYIADRFPAIAV